MTGLVALGACQLHADQVPGITNVAMVSVSLLLFACWFCLLHGVQLALRCTSGFSVPVANGGMSCTSASTVAHHVNACTWCETSKQVLFAAAPEGNKPRPKSNQQRRRLPKAARDQQQAASTEASVSAESSAGSVPADNTNGHERRAPPGEHRPQSTTLW